MEYILTNDEDFNIWLMLQRTSNAMLKIRERELHQYGISSINAAVLLLANSMPDTINSARISQQLLRDANTISELIVRMEKNGLVKKVKDLPKKNMKRIVPLRKMAKNQKGIIKRVSAKGEMGRRIREMGLVPNTPVKIQGRAPLKDPVAIKVRDFTLTLRNNEADSIMVEIEETGEETV